MNFAGGKRGVEFCKRGWPELLATDRSAPTRRLLRANRTPHGASRLDGHAACPDFPERKDVATRPKSGLERCRIPFGQAGVTHLCGSHPMLVGDGVVLDRDAILARRQNAEPAPGCSVVGRHADSARVVPEAAVDRLRERNSAMPGDDAGDAGMIELIPLAARIGRGENEPADYINAAMDDREACSTELDIDAPGQCTHPGPRIRIEHALGICKPLARQPFAGAAGGKTTAAVGRSCGETFLAIASHDMNSGVTHQSRRTDRVGPVGNDVAGANNAVAWNRQLLCLREHGLGRFEIAVGSPEYQHGSVDVQHGNGAGHRPLSRVSQLASTPSDLAL